MIKIVLTCGAFDELLAIDACGHAECGILGNDPVCAAVSFLLRSVALYLQDFCEVKAETRGDFHLKVLSENDSFSMVELQFLFRFMKIGIESLVNEVPRSVKLKIKQV